MRQVILHIGMHKTGTSSLQASMHNINCDGFRTVRFGLMNHSMPMYTIFSENRFNYRVWKQQVYTDNKINDKKTGYEKILCEEIADKNVNVFLISGEDISKLTENEQLNLCNFFLSKDLQVRVIYVTRDPFSFASSANQQRAQNGAKSLEKINPFYRSRLSGFIKGCAKENISVFKYEDLIQDGLVYSFSKIIGFELEEGKRLNESLSHEALALMYKFNNIKTPTTGSKLNFLARKSFVRAIQSFFSEHNGFKKLNLIKYNLVDEAVVEDLFWLEKNFGISYQLPDRKKEEGLELEDYPSSDCLSEFFKLYKLRFDTNISLVDNLENLYKLILSSEKTKAPIDNLLKAGRYLTNINFKNHSKKYF